VNRFSIAVDIPAAPDRVWEVLADVERWPEWTPSVTRITRLDPGPLAVGSRARIHQPRLLPATWRIGELGEGRRFTRVTGSPGVWVVAEHAVERHLGLEAAGLRERSVAPGWHRA
jgi:uncharacterized protein YndB with AHSA1/START domain